MCHDLCFAVFKGKYPDTRRQQILELPYWNAGTPNQSHYHTFLKIQIWVSTEKLLLGEVLPNTSQSQHHLVEKSLHIKEDIF